MRGNCLLQVWKCLQFQTRLRSYLNSRPTAESYHALFVVSIKVALKTVFFRFDDVESTALHLSIEMIENIENISHVRQNENELRIFEAICVTMFVLSQKKG